MDFKALETEFNQLNTITEPHSFDRIKFCWKLIEFDTDEYLETHLFFLEKANKNFKQDLQYQFRFRKNKEKVHHYLQNKLKENISEKLKTSITQIIEDIDFKTIDEYKHWISEIKANKRDDKMDFVHSIMRSPYVAYHFDLLKDKALDDKFINNLATRFNEHKESGAVFLLDKLKQNTDVTFHAQIIFLLGRLATYNKKETLKYARKLTNSKDDIVRENAIIVLGWVGGVREFSILKDGLLNDLNSKCRAWSASSFMQMWFNKESEKLREFALNTYKEALAKETDYFVLSTIIESVQEIENKKFSISQKSLDNLDKVEIDKAKNSVVKYINTALKK